MWHLHAGRHGVVAVILVAASLSADAGSTADWKNRSVYQVLTDRFARSDGSTAPCRDLARYCGGSYKGIINHLDYIQGMGFDAIWISPIVKNFDGGYHGYWASNWEEVNQNFGTEQDIKNLVSAAHSRGIWVMVDVVANHVGPVGNDFSQIYPLNKPEHYHSNCDIFWGDQWSVENCRLSGLPDLSQENSWVRGYLQNWVRDVVSRYGFDGIRIDTVPEVPKDFWREYADASGVFAMGECFNDDPSYVGSYQNYLPGLFNYPMYYTIVDVFRNQQSMYGIRAMLDEERPKFQDLSALGIFVDNHDNPRFLNGMGDHTKFTSAIVFALTAEGIPFTYYGSEQYFGGGADPANRESLWQSMNTTSPLYLKIAQVNRARKIARIWTYPHTERYVADDFYAFTRGKFLVALTNRVDNKRQTVAFHPFEQGETICNVFYPDTDCQSVTAAGVDVWLNNGEQKIFVPKRDLLHYN